MIETTTWQRNWRVLRLGQFLTTAGLTLLVPFLPFYMENLGASSLVAAQLWSGLALAAPALTLSIAAPFWGRAGDRWGRKWMVVRALLGLAASLVLMGLSTTPLQFLLCRLMQGACGGITDAATAFAGAEAPPETRGRILGSLQSATAAGSLAGPLLAGPFIDLWGLRPLLLVAGALTAASALVSILVLREEGRPNNVTKQHQPVRRTIWGLLHHRRTRAFLLAGLCAQAGAYGLVTVFAPHVRSLLPEPDRAATWVGLLQAGTWTASVIGATWWGRRNDSAPIEQTFISAAFGCGLSIALQGLALSIGTLFPLRLLQGFCFSALAQSVYLRVSRAAAADQQGLQVGIANSFLTGGQIAGSLAGALLGGLLSSSWMFALMGCLFGVGAVLVWQCDKKKSQLRLKGDTVVR